MGEEGLARLSLGGCLAHWRGVLLHLLHHTTQQDLVSSAEQLHWGEGEAKELLHSRGQDIVP